MGAVKLKDVARAILYDSPTHSPRVMPQLKTVSWDKFEYPEHLKPYAGQIRECPTQCAGRKGSDYRNCLIDCASKVRKPEEEKRAARRAYAKKIAELRKTLVRTVGRKWV